MSCKGFVFSNQHVLIATLPLENTLYKLLDCTCIEVSIAFSISVLLKSKSMNTAWIVLFYLEQIITSIFE